MTRQAVAINAPTTMTNAQYAMTLSLLPNFSGPARYVASRKPSTASAPPLHGARTAPTPCEHEPGREGEERGEDDHRQVRAADPRVAEHRVAIRVDEEAGALLGGRALGAHLHHAPFHVVGRTHAEQVEHRGRDVGDIDESRATAGRRPQQTGLDAGRADRRNREPRSAARSGRPDDDDSVTREVDLGEHPADKRIRLAKRAGFEHRELLGSGEAAVEISAEEVGAFHQNDTARLPRGLERAEDDVGIEPQPERRGRITHEQLVAHASAGHDAVAIHQRGHGRALVLGQVVVDYRLRTVGIGDDRSRHVNSRQRVTEGAECGVVHAGRVLLVKGVDSEMDQPRAHREAGPLTERLAGGGGSVGLARLERLPGKQVHRRRAAAGAQRGVPARRRVPTPRDTGDQIGDGRTREQRLEVGCRSGLDVGPRHGGK